MPFSTQASLKGKGLCWWPNLIFWENQRFHIPKPRGLFFNVTRWSKSLYQGQHCVSQVGFICICLHVMHVLPVRFGWISHKKQRSAWKYKNMEPNWIFELPMLKPSSRWSKWIHGTHNLKIEWGSYNNLKMLQAVEQDVSESETGRSCFHGS
jgi:hypothetical protein